MTLRRFRAVCLRCRYAMNGATNPLEPEARPRDGNLSVCLGCGNLAAFNVNPFGITLRELTAEERTDALKDDHVCRILLARQVAADSDPSWPTRREATGD